MQLISLALTISVFLGVLAVGMRVSPADLSYLLRRPSQLVRSLLAMNVVAPIVTILVCRTFSLHGAVIVALVTLAISPVGALFSQGMLPSSMRRRVQVNEKGGNTWVADEKRNEAYVTIIPGQELTGRMPSK